MNAKIILTWNIKPGKEQEYFNFVVSDYLPKVSKLGLDLTDAWVTVYGNEPQILIGAITPSFDKAKAVVRSEAWKDLNGQLDEFVDDFTLKIAPQRGVFQF